jgi:small subunit ribosomal protein S1
MYLEQERARLKVKLFETIEEGHILEGTISNLMEYGAFVDIGGADGLLHISDMAYTRVNKPSEVVSIGQKVTVMVLKVDKEKERISLGLKQIAPDPWADIDNRIKAGDQLSGRVLRIADFGAFIEVESGVEGLLPASEITWKRHARPTETVRVGDVLRLVVLQIDGEKKRLSLSLKQAAGDPWADAEARYPVNSLVTGTVQSTTDFGAFVEIEAGLEGLVHISELSSKRVNAVEDVVKAGESHEFRVLEIDSEQRRIRLSKKAVDEPVAEVPAENAGNPQPAKAAPQKRNKPLRGGMDVGGFGGIGLGNLKL